jgi:hypothetical protein
VGRGTPFCGSVNPISLPRLDNSANLTVCRIRCHALLAQVPSKLPQVASHLAYVTLALDVREARNDFLKLMGYVSHGMALIKVLKEYKNARAMHPTQWQNDAHAIIGIITVDGQQEAWLARVLSDPVAGKERLATSRV